MTRNGSYLFDHNDSKIMLPVLGKLFLPSIVSNLWDFHIQTKNYCQLIMSDELSIPDEKSETEMDHDEPKLATSEY